MLLGLIARQSGRQDLAVHFAGQACSLSPTTVNHLHQFTRILHESGQLREAASVASRAVELAPQDLQSHCNLGLVLMDLGARKEAVGHIEKALTFDPHHDQSLTALAVLKRQLGKVDEAVSILEDLLKRHPDKAVLHSELGNALFMQGDLETAQKHLEQAIKLDPEYTEPLFSLSNLKTFTQDDDVVKNIEALAQKAEQMAPANAQSLWFTIGKAYEDVGRFDEAFEAYRKGNDIYRAAHPFDEKRNEDFVERTIRNFGPDAIKGYPDLGCLDNTTIFIVGMPRSGTTLIEQILASHSSVYGGGEQTHLNDVYNESLIPQRREALPELAARLTDAQKKEMGEEYIRRQRQLSAESRHVTDKMPSNHYLLGLIPIIVPNAKIIHCTRDPMDVCFSNYAQLFRDGQLFSYNLNDLAREYRRYERLMAHWKQVLPSGVMLDVAYEDVVSDLEQSARQLIDHCGLPWEDHCLDFHKTKRSVKTASAAQVRRPVYKSSVGRWRHFEKHLAPLADALRP